MVPLGFGFEGADIVVKDMDLMMLREAAMNIVRDHRSVQV